MVDDVFTSRHVEFTDTCLSLCRSMCQLTSLMLPRKRRVSQEVTSERCVVMPPCSVSETSSTLRTTGICLFTCLSVCPITCLSFPLSLWLVSLPVCVSVHQRTSSVQSIRRTSTKRSVRWRNLNQQDTWLRCTLLWTEHTHTHTYPPLPVCLYMCVNMFIMCHLLFLLHISWLISWWRLYRQEIKSLSDRRCRDKHVQQTRRWHHQPPVVCSYCN